MSAALASACVSLAVVLASRAADPVLGLLAVVGCVAAIATLAARSGRGGLAVVDPLWTLILLLRGSVDVWSLLPLWAAQAVGALGAGVEAGYLVEELPVLTLTREPSLVVLGASAALAGLLAGWLVVAADDASIPAGWAAVPSAAAAVVVPVWLVGAAALAPLFAAGVAGVTEWSDVFVTALTLAAGGVAGALSPRLLGAAAA